MAKLPAQRFARHLMSNAVAWARGRKRADPERTRWALWQAIAAAEENGGDVRLSQEFARTLAAELDHLPNPNGRPVAPVDHELRQERIRREYQDMRARGVSQREALAELTREVRAEGQPVSEEAVKKWVQGGDGGGGSV